MAQPLKVSFTPNLEVSGNYTIAFTAISPTTGALVSGVKISQASITGRDLNALANAEPSGVPPDALLVPENGIG